MHLPKKKNTNLRKIQISAQNQKYNQIWKTLKWEDQVVDWLSINQGV